MKKTKWTDWIIVTEKWTYALLGVVGIAILKFLFYDLMLADIYEKIPQIIFSFIIALCGLYFFIRLNTWSEWLNPNHPRPKIDYDDDKQENK